MAWKKGLCGKHSPLVCFGDWIDGRNSANSFLCYMHMEHPTDPTLAYARRLQAILAENLTDEALASALDQLSPLYVDSRLVALREAAAMVWGLPGHPDYTWEDARPDLTQADKQALLREVLASHLGGAPVELPTLFHRKTAYIHFRDERIRVEEVLHEAWGYILYRALDEEAYYLNVMKNMSFAYYDETYRLDKSQGEAFIAQPSYAAALANPGEPER